MSGDIFIPRHRKDEKIVFYLMCAFPAFFLFKAVVYDLLYEGLINSDDSGFVGAVASFLIAVVVYLYATRPAIKLYKGLADIDYAVKSDDTNLYIAANSLLGNEIKKMLKHDTYSITIPFSKITGYTADRIDIIPRSNQYIKISIEKNHFDLNDIYLNIQSFPEREEEILQLLKSRVK